MIINYICIEKNLIQIMAALYKFDFDRYKYYPEYKNKKKAFCGFESAKMHCDFTYLTDAFHTRFDRISNLISNKGDRNR